MTIQNGTSPTDLELMRYLDGELDAERSAELAVQLEQDSDARDKLAALRLSGDLLRQIVEDDARADGIADAVMIKVGVASESQPPPGKVVDLPRRDPGDRVEPGKPANDNARLIYFIATAAAAVAAGLYFWSNDTPDETPRASTPPPVEAPAPAPAPAPTAVAEAEAAQAEGVEIAAVDFGGGKSGSVFYISAPEQGAAATAVVWVTDPGE